jgi:protein SCO1/2
MTKKKIFPSGTAFLFGLFLIVMLVTYLLVRPPAPPPELLGVLRPEFRLLQPFELTDHNKDIFDQKRLKGKWTLVFFGYTSCPDICPATLYVLNSVQGLLEDETGEVPADMQVVFISVDPERDTTEKLAAYITHFNKRFIGATADKTAIDKLTWQFGAGYVLEPETAPGHYLVAHTSAIFLVDPLGRLVASFSQPHYPKTITSQYQKIQDYFYGN